MMLFIGITAFCWLAGLGGMVEYLIFAFILTGVLVLSWAKEESFTSYLPPSGYEIDHGKMNRDLAKGVGREEVKRRTVRGYYNVRKK